MSTKSIVAASVLLSESADGTRSLTIPSKTETIIVEMSPKVWAQLSDTAKWFGPPELLAAVRTEEKQPEENSKETK